MKRKAMLMFTVVLPLLAGCTIYICYRHSSLYMFQWFDRMGLAPLVTSIRHLPVTHDPPAWLVYNLPDALWIYAFSSMMFWVWHYRITATSIGWLLLGPIVGISSELGQYIKIVPGTFDILDLTFILAASLIPFLQTKIIKNENAKN